MVKNAARIVAAMFVVGFALIAWAGWSIWATGNASAALMAEGAVEVVGRVVSLDVEQSVAPMTTRTAPKANYNYYAVVAFEDAEGQFQRVRTAITAADYSRLQTAQDLPLRYAAADPRVIELRAGDLASNSVTGFWMMLAGLCGILLTVLVLRSRSRRSVERA
jgi:hypothetical protein